MDSKIKFKEIAAILFCIGFLILWQGQLWITRRLMVTHDSALWYGIFSYFIDCLHNGFFPFWNPYMNSGEPFFLNISILRLWDPSVIFLALMGKLLKINIFTLYHYDLLLRFLVFICGCYFLFRYISKYKISAFIAFITISFSTLSVSYMRQHAFILHIYLLPLLLLFIFKLFEKRKVVYMLGAACILGLVFPSYSTIFILSFVFILLLSLFITRGLFFPNLRIFFTNYKISVLAVLVFIFLSVRIVPLGIMFKQGIVPVVRMFEVPLAACAFPADFLGLFSPYYFLCYFLHIVPEKIIPEISESFLYIGLLPLLFSLIGLFFSRHRYKFGFLITVVTVGLLMLGGKTPVYGLFVRFFPFFSIVRNMHIFGPFFLFCLCYFVCIGVDVVCETLILPAKKFSKKAFWIVFIFLCLAALISTILLVFRLQKVNLAIAPIIEAYKVSMPLELEKLRSVYSSYQVRSFLNITFFILSSGIIFFIFKKTKINLLLKYGLLILFILIDLISFNHIFYRYTTYPLAKDGFGLPQLAVPFAYQNFCKPRVLARLPFTAFTPVILKKFSSSSQYILKKDDYAKMEKEYYIFLRSPLVAGTHFFETKDYHKFQTAKILDEVKEVWLGISSSRVRLVPKAIVFPSGFKESELGVIDLELAKNVVLLEERIPKKYAYLETTFADFKEEGAGLGRVEVEEFNPNELKLKIHAERDCFLYYSDGYDKSWRAFVNDKESKLYKANLAFKAIIIPEGAHEVRFLYDPKFYKFSLFCYFLGLLSFGGVCIAVMIIRFKSKMSLGVLR